jgi:prolyl oligopeptidase
MTSYLPRLYFFTNSCSAIDCCCSEYLVAQKYISPSKTAILGLGAGAELVADSITRAPVGTFGCVIADRGAYDLLRVSSDLVVVLCFASRFYGQFPLFTPGLYWIGLLGDPFAPRDFDFIYPRSPLHNRVISKPVPPTLLITGNGT